MSFNSNGFSFSGKKGSSTTDPPTRFYTGADAAVGENVYNLLPEVVVSNKGLAVSPSLTGHMKAGWLKGRKGGPISGNIDSDDFSSIKGGAVTKNPFIRFIRSLLGLFSLGQNMEKVGGSIKSTMEKRVEEEVNNVPDKVILTLDRFDPVIELQWGQETVNHRVKRKDTTVNSTDVGKTKKRNDSINRALINRAKKRYKNGNQ